MHEGFFFLYLWDYIFRTSSRNKNLGSEGIGFVILLGIIEFPSIRLPTNEHCYQGCVKVPICSKPHQDVLSSPWTFANLTGEKWHFGAVWLVLKLFVSGSFANTFPWDACWAISSNPKGLDLRVDLTPGWLVAVAPHHAQGASGVPTENWAPQSPSVVPEGPDPTPSPHQPRGWLLPPHKEDSEWGGWLGSWEKFKSWPPPQPRGPVRAGARQSRKHDGERGRQRMEWDCCWGQLGLETRGSPSPQNDWHSFLLHSQPIHSINSILYLSACTDRLKLPHDRGSPGLQISFGFLGSAFPTLSLPT